MARNKHLMQVLPDLVHVFEDGPEAWVDGKHLQPVAATGELRPSACEPDFAAVSLVLSQCEVAPLSQYAPDRAVMSRRPVVCHAPRAASGKATAIAIAQSVCANDRDILVLSAPTHTHLSLHVAVGGSEDAEPREVALAVRGHTEPRILTSTAGDVAMVARADGFLHPVTRPRTWAARISPQTLAFQFANFGSTDKTGRHWLSAPPTALCTLTGLPGLDLSAAALATSRPVPKLCTAAKRGDSLRCEQLMREALDATSLAPLEALLSEEGVGEGTALHVVAGRVDRVAESASCAEALLAADAVREQPHDAGLGSSAAMRTSPLKDLQVSALLARLVASMNSDSDTPFLTALKTGNVLTATALMAKARQLQECAHPLCGSLSVSPVKSLRTVSVSPFSEHVICCAMVRDASNLEAGILVVSADALGRPPLDTSHMQRGEQVMQVNGVSLADLPVTRVASLLSDLAAHGGTVTVQPASPALISGLDIALAPLRQVTQKWKGSKGPNPPFAEPSVESHHSEWRVVGPSPVPVSASALVSSKQSGTLSPGAVVTATNMHISETGVLRVSIPGHGWASVCTGPVVAPRGRAAPSSSPLVSASGATTTPAHVPTPITAPSSAPSVPPAASAISPPNGSGAVSVEPTAEAVGIDADREQDEAGLDEEEDEEAALQEALAASLMADDPAASLAGLPPPDPSTDAATTPASTVLAADPPVVPTTPSGVPAASATGTTAAAVATMQDPTPIVQLEAFTLPPPPASDVTGLWTCYNTDVRVSAHASLQYCYQFTLTRDENGRLVGEDVRESHLDPKAPFRFQFDCQLIGDTLVLHQTALDLECQNYCAARVFGDELIDGRWYRRGDLAIHGTFRCIRCRHPFLLRAVGATDRTYRPLYPVLFTLTDPRAYESQAIDKDAPSLQARSCRGALTRLVMELGRIPLPGDTNLLSEYVTAWGSRVYAPSPLADVLAGSWPIVRGALAADLPAPVASVSSPSTGAGHDGRTHEAPSLHSPRSANQRQEECVARLDVFVGHLLTRAFWLLRTFCHTLQAAAHTENAEEVCELGMR